ncbi:hypothetical protein JCM8097_009139 [Rhodosporidiobolus ruineniae]
MFASPLPPTSQPFLPSSSSSHLHSRPPPLAPAPPAAADYLPHATRSLSLHDQPHIQPAASAGASSMPSGSGAKADEGRQPRKRGRKRIEEDLSNIKGNDSLDAEAKRKLQNRAAQRAFRERKEKHVADLEAKVKVQEDELAQCRDIIRSLWTENAALRRGEHPAPISLPPTLHDLLFVSSSSLPGTASPPSSHTALHLDPPSQSPPDVKPIPTVSPPLPQAPQMQPASPSLQGLLNEPAEAAYLEEDTKSEVIPEPFDPAAQLSAPGMAFALSQPAAPASFSSTLPPLPPRPPSAPVVADPVAGLLDVDMATAFDFDAPFTFPDSLVLPSIFDFSLPASSSLPTSTSDPTSASSDPSLDAYDDTTCPGDDDDPPPLPGGRIPCDKPQCDFSSTSCQLPIPWRPPPVFGEDKDLWRAEKCWAKLLSHPLFDQCSSDDLCQELRDKTRCSEDGTLVCHKSDVCDIFRTIPAKARERARAAAEGGVKAEEV